MYLVNPFSKKVCKIQKGLFKTKTLFLVLLKIPASIGFMGFSCVPPLTPRIKTKQISRNVARNIEIFFIVLVILKFCWVSAL